ncbi:TonB-dependent receptor [Gammaproteobacteria bacterium LSUCC0057]|uniref:TonB-dependent receptor n=1 Tax=Gammaproteobacteria bacterium LSUCC0057 TaxID=2559237 RepID=A0A4Y8ULM2_9GAMM|nr:TonB-dependent receptor [Gammaproteobacteria bacterium LSUCC0057]
MRIQNRLAMSIAAIVATAAPAVGAAQLEEITVTAQYRAENVQDVPIAITAMSGDMMAKADISDLTGIAERTPGLTYMEFSPGQTIPSLRGISSADDGAGLDNSAALFLDGVYIGRSAGINFDMYDLERVEVLRGPQGTLFGRNAIGGAISVVSAKPSQETRLKAGITAGNEGIFRAQALASGGLTDNLAGKLTVSHRQHDGFVDNVLLGTELQDEDSTSVRGQLLFSGDSSEWLLTVDSMEDDRADMGRTAIVNNAPLTNIAAANGVTGPRQNASPKDGYSSRDTSGISLQGDFDLGNGTLTTITALRKAETDWSMASAGVSLGPVAPFDEVMDDIVEEIDTFSQEIRWSSTVGDNINYTVGAFYFTEETDRTEIFRTTVEGSYDGFALVSLGDQATRGNDYTRTENETTSYALFGQADWTISEQLSLSIGARFTRDEKDYVATAVNCAQVVDGTNDGSPFEDWAGCGGVGASGLNIVAESFRVTPSDSWNDFSPKIALNYTPSEGTMIYGTISKGFKSGGFAGSQGVESAASNPVDPEEVINYEVGFKSDLSDTLRVNASLFMMDYTDLQIVRFGPVPDSEFGTFQTTNIGEADITGVETEFTWYASDNLRFSGFYAYLESEANDLSFNGNDYSGASLRSAPKNSYSLAANYTLPASYGTWEFSLDYNFTDEQTTDFADTRIGIDDRALVNGYISLTSLDEAWDISLWGKNVTDEDYLTHMYVIGPGGIGVWGAPATFGVTVTWSN